MKFTNGYWLMRKEITPSYAVEYWVHEVNGNELVLHAPSKHVGDRGDTLDSAVFAVTLSSPMENVIKVSLVHFKGKAYKGPFATIKETNPHVEIIENEKDIIYKTGTMKAVICKEQNNWKIEYYDGDELLTETSYRNMAHMHNSKTNKSYMVEQLALDIDEYVYGLGERFTPFVKNGQIVEMWNEDGGTSSEIAYKNIPFYVTNRGYGVFVDNEGDTAYEIASEKVERVQFSVEGERLDYYIISGGSPKGTIQKYTELTGKPALPPAWSFGLWLTTSFTTSYDEETVTSFIQGMEDRDIPLHVFHFDCFWMEAYEWCNFEWDKKTFPDPMGMLKRFHDRGLKICVWINPYIGQKSKLFDEGMERGYLLKTKDGDVWQTNLWQGGMALVDFTNPAAVEWYQSKLEVLLDMGVDCFKTDFGERIPVADVEYFDHSDPVKMHNYYTFLYNKSVFELLERKRGKGEATLFARSATVGGQQFPVHWGGDCSATYPSMAETLRGGLSLAASGFGFWSHDIGGFEQTAPADVYKRWCAFGLLSSHSRLHGSKSYRVPWLYDDEACDVLRKFVKIKCGLMPYLYGQAVLAHEEGIPMLRPMFVEFPEDRTCETLDKEYMLGDSLLVAPIFKKSGKVEYYLPEGSWINYITGEVLEGGRWIQEKHGYDTIPLMVRENSILPIGSCQTRPDYDYTDGITFYVSKMKDGSKARVSVPDLLGKTVMEAEAERIGNKIMITVRGNSANWKAALMEDGDARVEINGNQAVIIL
ncbi:alpha-xylosidase [Anaerobium acetethylicum]|uniref:alpha-D-xyloside xylohydrolase n=1 Tax=Anaerobium acetethylicum TaxID=1619234 RepID=A0A1D3TW33_9FIRM|nr:alpha-xylosidase [Anaerobium acetethylicum]SCP98390.1 alpha-D-xyloside xylohydrolase [Anaerobium acetethylicum]